MTYFVTGGTGFIGRFLIEQLLSQREGDIHVLVRQASVEKLQSRWGDEPRIKPVIGDLSAPRLGVDDPVVERLTGNIDHFFHLAAIYDMTADDEANRVANVEGTRHAVELANALRAGIFHHTSSIAAAGLYKGLFREDMFDEGQKLDHPYHRTKFESEKIARTQTTVPWRVYRPAIVVGSSQTGEMDKIDGPYYFFTAIKMARHYLPGWFPLIGPELGYTNIVPVDYVAQAMDHIAHQPGLDGQAFHLTNPKSQRSGDVMNEIAKAAHAPQLTVRIDTKLLQALPKGTFSMLMQLPAARGVRKALLADFGIPDEVLGYIGLTAQFDTRDTERALDGSGISVPALASYATKLWDYWERNLDPDLFKDRSFEGAVNGKTVLITGASSGIGKAAAFKIAKAGGIPLLVARSEDKLLQTKREIEDLGGTAYAYTADVSDTEFDRRARGQGARRPRRGRRAGQQRRPLDPPLDRSLIRPLPRLRADDPAQLPRHDQADHGVPAAHARSQVRSGRERLLDRSTDEPAAVQRLRGLEGGLGCVDPCGWLRDDRRQRPLHDDPHAARAHADDRPDEDLRQLPDDLPG